MASRETVTYKDRTFHIQSTGRYFQDGNHNGLLGERLLHRLIWTEKHGPIPEKTCIHHKDGDWRNNKINNLEAVPVKEHSREHMQKRFKSAEFRKQNKIHLAKAIAAAPKWHTSKAGILWHTEHGKKSFKIVAKKRTHKCVFCKKKFTATTIQSKLRFCSQSCVNKFVWRTKLVVKKCLECGKDFSTNKYSGVRFCGYSCSAKARWKNEKRKLPRNGKGQFKSGRRPLIS